MKTVYKFLKDHLAMVFLFLIWTPITFFNTKIYWMLVDDGWDVVFSRTLFEKISSLNLMGFISQLLESGGRFRPTYWMYHMMVWFVGGNSYQFHHLAHMLVIGVTMLFIYWIVKELTNSKRFSFFAGLFYLLTPINTENVFRLGPQEPLLAMFLSIVFYLIIKNKEAFLASLVVVLAVFTKETSVALLPILFFYYIYSRKQKTVKDKKQGYYLWITICAASIVMILVTFLRRDGYSTNYYFDIPMLFSNLVIYLKELNNSTLLILSLVGTIYIAKIGITLIKRQSVFNSKIHFFTILSFIGFLSFLFIQLPWQYALTRYLLPTVFFMTVFIFLEIYNIFIFLSKLKFANSRKRIFTFFLTFVGVYVSLVWGMDLLFKEMAHVSTYDVFKKMASYPKDTVLLMNMKRGEGTIELVDEVQIHLSEFWGRSDIKSQYLDLNNLPKDNYIIVDSSQFPRGYPQEELNTIFGSEFTSINKTSRRLVTTTPLGLVTQTIKKVILFLIYKKEITSEGIYTYYYDYNHWNFYNEQ